jgi:beta-galactosidase
MPFRRVGPPMVSAGLLVLLLMGCDSPAEPTTPTEAAGPTFVPVDLTPFATGKDVENLPTGRQTFQGVKYQIGPRPLQLGSTVYPEFPQTIEGIAVGRTCRAVHFLHATQGGGYQQPGHPKHENDGVEVGRYVIHYEDGDDAVQPLIYGEQLRGWWDWDNNLPTPNSQMVWTGENAAASKYNRKIRLYWAVWENPHPEKVVKAIDFVSANAKAAPFCVAMTLETNEEPRTK